MKQMLKKVTVILCLIMVVTINSVMAAEYSGSIGRTQLGVRTFEHGIEINITTYRGGNDCTLWMKYADAGEVEKGVIEGYAKGQMRYTKNNVNVKLRFEKNEDGSITIYQLDGNPEFLQRGQNVTVYK